MGRNDIVIGAKVNIEAEIGNFEKGLKQIQNSLKQLHFSDSVNENFNTMFRNFEKEISTLKEKTKNNQVNLVDENSIKSSFSKVEELYASLIKKIKSEGGDSTLLEKDVELIKFLTEQVDEYNEAISKSDGEIEKATKEYEDQVKTVRTLKTLKDDAERKVARRDLSVQNEEAKLKNIQKQYEVQEQTAKQAQEEEEAAKRSVQWYKSRVDNLKKAQEAREAAVKKDYLDKHNGRPQGFKQQYDSQYGEEIKEEQKKIDEYTQKQAEAQEKLTKAQNQNEGATKRLAAAKIEVRDEEIKQTEALNKAKQAQEDANIGLKNASDNYDAAILKLNDFEGAIKSLKADEFKKIQENIDSFDWSKFGIPKPVITSQEELTSYISKLTGQSQEAASALIQGLEPALQGIKESGQAAKQGAQEAAEGAKKIASVQSDLERLTNRLSMFFSIDNAVRLFRRAIRSATNAIKDLDKVMTETAVVTEFSIGDMWKQLPDYTKRANELGLAVRDVYQASTLYYQQGLQTNEVMQVTNATLRMARIASLDASEATDRMTNALRGFNMEINEVNADNVADVYSKLAAISASNVDEISTAMTKVASLANNANMSFENTAAFLSQIIETTRESAETAGTALKTVIARFSEVKELRTKGELLGTDEEGEEIDVNKVSEALRSAGINLNEYLTGAKGLDDIFMELASKWDSLDMVQQRYIATMAAGSRQQSRFIALMSDYKRTQELTTAAQNASGASMEQYEKTLESIETKLNRLKNAWNEFLMGIANDQFVRGFLDGITNILSAINKLTDSISGGKGLVKSIANIGVAIGGLKVGGWLTKTIFGDPRVKKSGLLTNFLFGSVKDAEVIGIDYGKSYQRGIFKSFLGQGKLKDAFKFSFKPTLSASELGLKTIDFGDINFKNLKNPSQVLAQGVMGIKGSLTEEQSEIFKSLNIQLHKGQIDANEYVQSMKNAGVQMNLTAEQADKLGVKFQNTTGAINTTSIAMMGIGAAMMGIGALFEKLAGEQTTLTKVLKTTGMALMGLGAILPMVSKAFQSFGADVSKTIMSIPIIGWIAAVITAVIALVTIISDLVITTKEAAENAQKNLEAATEAANAAAEAVDNLASSYNEIVDNADKLDDLTKGTKEWREAVQQNNKAVLDLLQNYKELNVISRDGILTITNYDQIMEKYNQRAINAQIGVAGASIVNTEAQVDLALRAANKKLYGANDLTDAEKKQLAVIAANSTEEEFKKAYVDILAQNGSDVRINEVDFTNSYEVFRSLGATVAEAETSINSWRVSIAASAAENAHLSEDQQKYSQSLINNTKALDGSIKNGARWYNGFLGTGRAFGWGGADTSTRARYEQYIHETYGESISVNWRGSADTTGDGKNNITWDTEKSKFYAWDAANGDYVEKLKKQTDYLVKLSKTTDDYNQSLAKSYEGISGELLRYDDLEAIYKRVNSQAKSTQLFDEVGEEITYNTDWTKFELTDLKNKDSDFYHLLYAYYTSDNELYNAFGGDFGFEGWAETFATNILSARDRIEKAYQQFNDKRFRGDTEDFASSTIESLTNALKKYTPTDSGEFAHDLIDALGLEGEDLEKAMQQISIVDWTNLRDLQGLKTTFENLGLNVAGEKFNKFIELIQNRVKSLNKIDLSKFKDNVSDIEKAIKDLKEGKQGRIFDEKLYEQIAPFVNTEDFQVTDYGVIYQGEDIKELGSIIEQGIADGFAEANKILENKISVGEVQEEAKKRGEEAAVAAGRFFGGEAQELFKQGVSAEQIIELGNRSVEEARARAELDYYLKHYKDLGGIGTLGIDDLTDNNMDTSKLTLDEMQHFLEEITNVALGKKGYEDEQASIEISKIISGGIEKVVESWADNSQAAEAALRKMIEEMGLPEEIAQQLLAGVSNGIEAQQAYDTAQTYAKASAEGYDVEQIKAYADQLERTKDLTKDLAAAEAARAVKVNTNFKKLLDSYKDWSKLFDKDGPLGKGKDFELGSEQFKVFNEMKKALQDSLGLTTDLSDEFFKLPENAKLLKTAMEGTAEEQIKAFEQLAKNVGTFIDQDQTIKIVANLDGAEEGVKEFQDYFNSLEFDDIGIGAYIETEGFQAALTALYNTSQESAKAIAEALHLKQEYRQVPSNQKIAIFRQDKYLNGEDDPVDWVPAYYTTEMVWVSDGTYTPPDIGGGGLGNAGTGNGNASSSKSKNWKNPYDELYNLQQRSNTVLRERERLEHQYQDMLKDHTKTSADLVDNTLKEIAALQKQLQLQKQLLAGRKKQIANVADEIYEDSEGNRASYAALGVTRYATYDAERNEIQIDYKALSQITDEKIGSAAQAYISQLENYQTEITNIEDTIEELNDNVIEIRQRGQQEYLNFEQKVYDAIVNEREKEIEALENVSQTIKDAADKTIQSVQDEINKERQLRENEKEEQSILDKQMRLAYLRRDTSGANALEIKKLEEELANDTQSYQDKIIDQTIQQMQDDAAKAAEQREQQIELLKQSLELDKATGEIWDKVWEYISEGYDEEIGVKEGTALDRVLKLASGYAQMSRFGQLNQIFETNKEAALGMSGLRNWMLTEAKNNGGELATNDGKAVYNADKGLWWYKGKHYTDEDFVLDLSTGKMKLGNIQNSTNNQTSETTKSGPYKVTANGVPTEMYDVNDGHVAWTTAGGEQFDLVSEDGEDYIVANKQGARYRTRKKGWKKENGFVWNAYAQGGLVDTTGPAWLDGSKSRPEMVLDAADTRNLITLKNVLASILNNAKSSNANQIGGDNYFNIDIQAEIDSDYDVDQLADRIKKQIYDDASYRNVNVISTMR